MAFPTIPTVAAGRVLTGVQANTTATRTFPNLSGLTKNAGDLLIAIAVGYNTSVGTDAAFSGWTGGFTEFHDSATNGTMPIGLAYKWSTGSETGTIAVTQAATITGHAGLILLSIPDAHATTPPEAGGRASGTTAAADPASFDPAGWAAEDTLWIVVGGSGETGTGGAFQGLAGAGGGAPANYTDDAYTGISADVVGGVEAGAFFRQLNAASEDAGPIGPDISNARNAAVVIAVRPAQVVPTGTGAISVPSATVAGTGVLSMTGTGVVAAPSATVSGTGEEVFTATGAVTVPSATVAGTGDHSAAAAPTGTGAISVPSATVAGTGALIFTGTGAIAVPAPAVVGSGAEGFTGTGAIIIPAPSVAGTGGETFTATGSIGGQAPTVVGSGLHAPPVTGTGAITVPSGAVAGTGSHSEGGAVTGTGAVTVPSATVAGSGALIITGTGAISIPSAMVVALGSEVFTGSGAVVGQPPTVTGTGLHAEEVTGTGAISVPAPILSAVGLQTQAITGTGAISAPSPSVVGAGSSGAALIVGGFPPVATSVSPVPTGGALGVPAGRASPLNPE